MREGCKDMRMQFLDLFYSEGPEARLANYLGSGIGQIPPKRTT
jgi:hypothetical protein